MPIHRAPVTKRRENKRKTRKDEEKQKKKKKPKGVPLLPLTETAQKFDFYMSVGFFEICWVSLQFRNISRDRAIKRSFSLWCRCLPRKLEQSGSRSRPRHMGGDRTSGHPCLSEAKILSLWHTFNISGCTCGSTFTSISVST